MKHIALLLLVFCFFIALALLPLPLPPYLDFQVIYHANMGLLRGIPLYDHAGQVNMIAELARVRPEQVYTLPFPYPPWYALSTIFLALLPIDAAARLWFGLNLSMLFVSVWLLSQTESDDSSRRKQSPEASHPAPALHFRTEAIVPYLLAILFLPVFGTLFVGQYTLPVLLGAALWTYAVRRENEYLTALASVLLTFKPHLGGLLLLAALIHLWYRRDSFGRRALTYAIGAGTLLFLAGFLADPAWPTNYLQSLLAFRNDTGVTSCDLCASLPVALARLMTGQSSLAPALWIGLGLFLVLLAALVWTRRTILLAPRWLMAFAILAALLVNPYLLNYDFVLLLFLISSLHPIVRFGVQELVPAGLDSIPLRGTEPSDSKLKPVIYRGLLFLAYALPYLALGLWGREGNFAFSISALILLALTFHDTRQLDDSPRAA